MQRSSIQTRESLLLRLPNTQDVAAWEQLVELYSPLLRRIALQRGIRQADTDDLVQEVFCIVAESVQKWLNREDRGPFRAWLFTLTRNVSINFLTRRATRSLGLTGDAARKTLEDMAAPSTESSDWFELEYRREVFRWAVRKVRSSLSEETWQAFHLTHIEQLPIQEAAVRLGKSVGNIYIARSRVMARLQQMAKQFEVES